MQDVGAVDFDRGTSERIGVLLVNSGTPESPTARDVRRFLARFLSDPRIIEVPRALWLPILYGFVLPIRPAHLARKYDRIWTSDGSPLLSLSKRLSAALAAELAPRTPVGVTVELAMLYSHPGVRETLLRLREAGMQRLLVVPMFPQYCGATTGAVFDQVSAELTRWRRVPELRLVAQYHGEPGYIAALRASIEQHWQERGRTGRLLMSFHGIPAAYVERGDPYYHECQNTARLLADALNIDDGEWRLTFQSKFGPGRWLEPATSQVLADLPRRGVDSVTVICPGFAADCLETLEEIQVENRALFLAAGGREFQYVPALNAGAAHARFLAELVTRHCQGWAEEGPGYLTAQTAAGRQASKPSAV